MKLLLVQESLFQALYGNLNYFLLFSLEKVCVMERNNVNSFTWLIHSFLGRWHSTPVVLLVKVGTLSFRTYLQDRNKSF